MEQTKVCIFGKELLPKDRTVALMAELRKRNIKLSNLELAHVAIYVIGADSDRKLRNRAQQKGIPWILMNPSDDAIGMDYIFSVYVLPEDAAQKAWSVVHEPEKWTTSKGRE